jgi:heme a synthase
MRGPDYNPWLHRFAILTAFGTLLLIGVGGVVTSKEAGLAVPDWPTTYGYNMFLFPLSKMVGGILYEHSHRLAGAIVGMLTTVLAVWLALKESRRWVRMLGWVAWTSVIVQGVLGGLRVVWLKDEIGIVHACLAQSFFVVLCAIALFTSRFWTSLPAGRTPVLGARPAFLGLTLILFVQLALGATMRHEHAGLSIPDFPLAYGQVMPSLDAQSMAEINSHRVQALNLPATTAVQILLQLVHRAGAIVILASAIWVAVRFGGLTEGMGRLTQCLLLLVVFQGILGASTVWSNKAADIATAHVMVGALTLAVSSLLTILAFRCLESPLKIPATGCSLADEAR